jgi:shikimate dehydrogenase
MSGPANVTTSGLRAGLIGAGIQASRSPFMHMTEARDLGLDLSYELFDLDKYESGAAALPQVLAEVRARGFLGVNITYPVKQSVLPLLDSYSDDVSALGACNTVVFQDGKATGHNTDWLGFAENFRLGLPGAALDTVVQLGAGGAGSAVTYALLKMGAGRIIVHEIDAARAEASVRRFNDLAGAERIFLSRDLPGETAAASGVVNCTPVGMAKLPGSPLPENLLRPDLWVADIVYFPLRTELLRQAAARGCRILEGGGMAVFQAAEALRLFTGRTPATERMLRKFQHAARAERAGT